MVSVSLHSVIAAAGADAAEYFLVLLQGIDMAVFLGQGIDRGLFYARAHLVDEADEEPVPREFDDDAVEVDVSLHVFVMMAHILG